MGTEVAPTYATLVLGCLEEILYEKIRTEKGKEFAKYIEDQWKRYLDDRFMFWQNSHEDLDLFEHMLNSLHKDLKFKIQTNCVQLPFLDILVMKEGTSVSTDIYYKATDSKQYLNFNSCHPKHTKINIPFSLARRLCIIISNKSTLDIRLKELTTTLIERKYPLQIIKSGITRALEIPRENLLRVHEKNEENITPFISTYSPKNLLPS